MYWYLLYITVVSVIAFLPGIPSESIRFNLLTIFLVLHTLAEAVYTYRHQKRFFLINPILLAATANFLVYNGGITNLLLLENGTYLINDTALELSDQRHYLTYTMYLTCLASVCMWIGYKLKIGGAISRLVLKIFSNDRLLKVDINQTTIMILLILGYGAKLILLQYGLFGRLTDLDQSTFGGEQHFLISRARIIGSISLIPFAIISYQYFSKPNKKKLALFGIVFVLEFFFAFISGARGPIVMTAILLFLTYYFATEQFRVVILLPLVVAVFFAFTVVQQFKEFVVYTDQAQVSIPTLIKEFKAYQDEVGKESADALKDELYYTMMRRLNFTTEAAKAIQDKKTRGLDAEDPSFILPLIMIPVDVFIPKSISGTPGTPWGIWFKDKVLNRASDLMYNISFSSIGYLNYAGGTLMIFIGFLIYGIALRCSYEFLNYGILGFLVYLGLLGAIVVFKTNIPAIFVSFIRTILFYPLVFYVVLGKHQLRNVVSAFLAK